MRTQGSGNALFSARAMMRVGAAALPLAVALASVATGAAIMASPAAAQDYTTGTIVGSVRLDTGEAVTGGTATATSNEQGFSRDAPITAGGTFRFPQLPVGTYTVTVTPSTGSPISQQNIPVSAGGSATYTFTVASGTAPSGEDVVVTGRVERGNDFAATTSGLALDVQQLSATIPINRNLTSLILLAPGTNSGDNGFGNVPSIAGASVSENQYYVNGLNITDFRDFIAPSRIPFEFYRTTDVQTGGLTAEFGRFLGGVTSSVTKSGSNDFKAGVVVAYSPNELTATGTSTYLENVRHRASESIDPSYYLSGPIIKNHLFFYALYNPYHSETTNNYTQTAQSISTTTDTPFIGGKLDAVITDTQRVEFTYFRDRSHIVSDYFAYNGVTDVASTALGQSNQTTGGDNFIGTYTGNFTRWFTLSGSYGQNRRVNEYLPSPNQAFVQSLITPAGTTTASGFSSSAQFNSDVRKVWRVDADVYAHLLGEHHFRFGYDNEDLTSINNVIYSGSGYRYILYPTYIRRYFYQNIGSFESKQAAYYLQDSWNLLNNRLNLQLGIRNDHFENYDANGAEFFDQPNQWGPRLGGSLDVFGDKRTKISAFFGRYFQPLATNTNIREAGRELYYRQYFRYPAAANPAVYSSNGVPAGLTFDGFGNPALGVPFSDGTACPASAPASDRAIGCNLITSDGTVHASNQLIAAGLKPSYSDEIKVGVSQRLADFTFGFTWIHRTLGRTLEDIAVDAGIIAYCNQQGIAGCADYYGGFSQYVVSNPGKDVTVVPLYNVNGRLGNPITLKASDLGYPVPQRHYDTFQVTVDKPYDGKWSVSGSYSYTKLRGNYEGSVDSTIDQTDTGITQDYDQPGLLTGAYGDLANGRSHQIKIFGAYSPVPWLMMGANLSVASPRKFSCIGNYPDADNFAYAYGAFSYFCQQPSVAAGRTAINWNDGVARTSYLVARGTAFQSNWYKQLDISLSVNLPKLPGSYIKLDVNNIFNWQDKLDFNEFGDLDNAGTNPNYMKVQQYTVPRSVRLTFAIRFGEKGKGTGTESPKQSN